jgi:hypothetical protein
MVRLKTEIWVQALLRRAELGGAFPVVVHRGDADAGAVMLCVEAEGGAQTLYGQVRDAAGEAAWTVLAQAADRLDAPQIAARIARDRERDGDLWVIDIQDRAGRHFLTEPVL